MNIAICDDEKPQRELLEKHVYEWAEKRNKKVSILLFENSEQFSFYWSEDKTIDLILLDIQMGKQNGVELARKIRKKDEDMQIVFITAIAEYIAEGYEVEALHYLVKPIDKERLFRCLDKASTKEKSVGSKLLLETKHGMVRIAVQDIWYLDALGHQTMVYTKDDVYEVKESIGKMEADIGLADTSFIKCHRSYLINLKHVSKVEKESVIMDDGRKIPMSRNSYKKVVQSFIGFYRRKDCIDS
ncbi:MAG: LytTR family DNA-binding domain-containing protein [Bacillota bacterium]|nr:LytTR family DNA-binding domain-containing protein [Bacillota bacterium]